MKLLKTELWPAPLQEVRTRVRVQVWDQVNGKIE